MRFSFVSHATVLIDQRPLAIALMGPTASGKTALAAQWCEQWNAEIISVDSALVYRGLNIGAAKPDAALLARAPHWMIDLRQPHETYSAADFAGDARLQLEQLHQRGKLPLLVGGTGLYFRALLDGLAQMPAADRQIRAQIELQATQQGWPALHAQLAQHDPAAAARIAPSDPQRIQRALEVWHSTGIPISLWQQQANQASAAFPFRVLKLVIAPTDRALLHQRIADRFDAMLAQGLLDEVRELKADPRLHADLPSMRAVGYRQAWQHLDGITDLTSFRNQAIAATRQLAKRQLTWFRSELDAFWVDPEAQHDKIQTICMHFLTRH